MKVSFQYNQDPRYGWASVDLEWETTGLIIVQTRSGSVGFNFVELDNSMVPTCICSAHNEGECSCPHVDWARP